MSTNRQELNLSNRNTELPFFPSHSWQFFQADYTTNPNTPTFNYIQAFFDADQLTTQPQVVVYSGQQDQNGNKIYSCVPFAYSGQMVPFKGKYLINSGGDLRGDSHQSTPIGNDATTDLISVWAYGGMF